MSIELVGLEVPYVNVILPEEAQQFLYEMWGDLRPYHDDAVQSNADLWAGLWAGTTKMGFSTAPEWVRIRNDKTWLVAAIAKGLSKRHAELVGTAILGQRFAYGLGGRLNNKGILVLPNVYLICNEDALSPTAVNIILNQENIRRGLHGLELVNAGDRKMSVPLDQNISTPIFRPRRTTFFEKHVLVDGKRMPAIMFDAGLYAFHNHKILVEGRDRGVYYYAAKIRTLQDIYFWKAMLDYLVNKLGIPKDRIRVNVLVETWPAMFLLPEILWILRDYIGCLNFGRWDAWFSKIKDGIAPQGGRVAARGKLTTAVPSMVALANHIIQEAHWHKIHGMGGMAAPLLVRGNPVLNRIQRNLVIIDKTGEFIAGFDGSWVPSPDTIDIPQSIFGLMEGDNQIDFIPEFVVTEEALLDNSLDGKGNLHEPMTWEELVEGAECSIDYWGQHHIGEGAARVMNRMEDAATAEEAGAGIHTDILAEDGHLDDGRKITVELVDDAIDLALEKFSHRNDGDFAFAANGLKAAFRKPRLQEYMMDDFYEALP